MAATSASSLNASGLLERHGLALIAEPESFLVSTDNTLRPGEEDRAQEWGEKLAAIAVTRATSPN
ncbi:MAG TPA: hypothetical protein VIX86_23475 [Streptosporangiaceae bacterium]